MGFPTKFPGTLIDPHVGHTFEVIYQPSQASGKPDQILRSAVEIIASSEDARCVQPLGFFAGMAGISRVEHARKEFYRLLACTATSGYLRLYPFIRRTTPDSITIQSGRRKGIWHMLSHLI